MALFDGLNVAGKRIFIGAVVVVVVAIVAGLAAAIAT
jgi:hypothetical protein